MSNPWHDSPQTQPTPQYQQPPQQNRRGGGVVGVLLGVVILMAVAAVAGVGWLLYNSGVFGSSSPNAPAAGTVVMQSTVVETQVAEPENPRETTTQRTTTTRTTTASPDRATPRQSQPTHDGLRADGWVDNTVTRCGGGEDLVYAGRGNNAWVTVCEGSGGLTYRSWVFDGHLTAPAAQTGPGTFVMDVAPSRIVVDHDVINIYTDGQLANSVRLTDVATR